MITFSSKLIVRWADVKDQPISFLFSKEIKEKLTALKVVCGNFFDQGLAVDYNGFLFTVSPYFFIAKPGSDNYPNYHYSLSFYDIRGTHSLGTISKSDRNPNVYDTFWRNSDLSYMENILLKHTQGIYQCNFCKEFKPRHETKFYPYAGCSCLNKKCLKQIPNVSTF